MNYQKFYEDLQLLKTSPASKNKSKDFERGFIVACNIIEILAQMNEYGKIE